MSDTKQSINSRSDSGIADLPDLQDWLALNRIKGFGPKRILALLEKFESPKQVFNAPAAELKHAGLTSTAVNQIKNADHQLEEDMGWLDAHSRHHIITLHDYRYPSLLKELNDPPILLYVNGDPELLTKPQLSIVGSRSATPGGLQIAREFAQSLSSAGLAVTSGLALGVDAAAHEGALVAYGKTIAVLGTGPDRIYPARHLKLAEQIVETGTIVSEFVPGTTPRKENFPRRNRVISGLSLGTLVVEAAKQSGSLITARFALEQGKEVFAIPGSIRNPQTKGCHALIREGAKLVESVEDIIEDLGPLYGASISDQTVTQANAPSIPKDDLTLQGDQKRLMEGLGYDPISVDEIVGQTGLTASNVSSILLALEIEGYVESQPGGRYTRKY
ncbi:MAG: DNA-processing protein DprA [Gammaproteobacteria bacterium]